MLKYYEVTGFCEIDYVLSINSDESITLYLATKFLEYLQNPTIKKELSNIFDTINNIIFLTYEDIINENFSPYLEDITMDKYIDQYNYLVVAMIDVYKIDESIKKSNHIKFGEVIVYECD